MESVHFKNSAETSMKWTVRVSCVTASLALYFRLCVIMGLVPQR